MPPKSVDANAPSSDLPAPIREIYDSFDSKVLSRLKTLKELVVEGAGINLIRFRPGESLDWSVDLSARYVPPTDRQSVLKRVREEMELNDEEEGDDDDEDEDGDSDEDNEMDVVEDSASGDDESERGSFDGFGSDDDAAMSLPPSPSSKRKGPSKGKQPPSKKKKVSFDPSTKATKGGKSDVASSKGKVAPRKPSNGKPASTSKPLKVANQPSSTSKARETSAVGSTELLSEAPYDFGAHFGA